MKITTKKITASKGAKANTSTAIVATTGATTVTANVDTKAVVKELDKAATMNGKGRENWQKQGVGMDSFNSYLHGKAGTFDLNKLAFAREHVGALIGMTAKGEGEGGYYVTTGKHGVIAGSCDLVSHAGKRFAVHSQGTVACEGMFEGLKFLGRNEILALCAKGQALHVRLLEEGAVKREFKGLLLGSLNDAKASLVYRLGDSVEIIALNLKCGTHEKAIRAVILGTIAGDAETALRAEVLEGYEKKQVARKAKKAAKALTAGSAIVTTA